MAVLENFDADAVDDVPDFEPIPAGSYTAVITESEFKPTKSGDGSYLELKFQVIEGEHQNRFLWSRLNLKNPSEKAVKFARAQLGQLCRAVGVPRPADTQELHDLPVVLKVKCRRREDTGEIANEIAGFESKDAQSKPQQSANEDLPPWKRQRQ